MSMLSIDDMATSRQKETDVRDVRKQSRDDQF